MQIGWNFPSNNYGQLTGIGEAGIETFKGAPYSSLAREICQNSLDVNNPVMYVDFNSNVWKKLSGGGKGVDCGMV